MYLQILNEILFLHPQLIIVYACLRLRHYNYLVVHIMLVVICSIFLCTIRTYSVCANTYQIKFYGTVDNSII